MLVDPVLEGVDGADPGQESEHGQEGVEARPEEVAAVVEPTVRCLQVLPGDELHGEARHLTELQWVPALPHQGLPGTAQRVEGVTGFVQHDLDVAGRADRVHEDEGPVSVVQRTLVASGVLATAVAQVEQIVVAHEPHDLPELRIEPGEDAYRPVQELAAVCERLHPIAVHVDRQVPGAQGVEPEA